MKFIDVLRQPDIVQGATEKTPFRFEEQGQTICPVKYEYVVEGDVAKVVVYPSGAPVKYLKLRFNGDNSCIDKVLGDQWERCGLNAYVEWRSVMANRVLPWYCVLRSGNDTACYGVKTGCDAFCFWQVDTRGITLFLNLKSGEDGVDLKAPLIACEIVQRTGIDQDCFDVVEKFCRDTCDAPVLPSRPVFGVNNWYWAYGDISAETVYRETDYLLEMCKGTKNRPYMVIDDGWQLNRTPKGGYIGGPWTANQRFSDMKKVADVIHQKGADAGLWFRPLLTREQVPEEAVLANECGGILLDPTHPFTLEKVENDAATIRSWGYDLIKHDFTTMDVFGAGLSSEKNSFILCSAQRKFYDKTITTATALKNLYKAIQKGAGGAEVIGCNVIGHLSAGIHSMQRVGADNSGNSFEWTRRDGINSMMRLPQNKNYFIIDPDCAAFTKKVHADANLDFLEMCAITGVTALASVTPGILNKEQMQRINQIFLIADQGEKDYKIKYYDKNANPERFISRGGEQEKEFDFDRYFNGSRIVVDWED